MGRREEKREATRQDILAAAGILFMKKGYDATSVDDIADAANVAKGTLYYHFKSKDEVLLGLSIGYLKRLNETVDMRLEKGESPVDVLVDSLKTLARETQLYKDLSRHFFLAWFSQMRDQIDCSYESDPSSLPNIISKIIRAAQEKGEIDSGYDARDLGALISGLSQHAQVTWIAGDENRPLVNKIDDWVNIILRGVRKPE